MMRILRLSPLSLCLSLLPLPEASADEKPSDNAPLAGLPSPAGPHVEKIKALGDGEWLAFGAPEPDPKWGPAPGRAYTNKMAYAPDLVGAFLQGEGVHGATGDGPREGHFNDDVFFYDLMGHRWICLYPGTKKESFKVKSDDRGFLADEDGQNLPIAIAVHGYECLSYNPKTREFMTLQTGSPYSRSIQARVREMVGEDALYGRGSGKHPYFYDVDTGRWFRRKVEGRGPSTGFTHALTWIPSVKKTVLYQRGANLWFYDHDAVAWENVSAKGGRPTTFNDRPSREGTLCYDSQRDRLYLFNRGQSSIPWTYDFKTNTMADLQAKNQVYPATNSVEEGVLVLGSTSSGAHYDSVADVVLMRMQLKKGTGDPRNVRSRSLGLGIYDPVTNEWSEEPVPLPEEAQRRGSWNSFYSPELNVHVFHIARDSRANGEIVLYRHKRAAE